MAQKRDTPQIPGQLPQSNKVFREFEGINTQAARQAIKETQFAWLENIMPIGSGNAKTVPAPSDVVQILSGEIVYYQHDYNIAGVSYTFYATISGAAYQVENDAPYTVTEIAPAATFPASGTQIAQWKNERILIINATNYYDWDGASLTVDGGTTSAPTAGQCIAVFQNIVWISNGRTLNWSKANSYTDFGSPGGNTIIADPTLTSDIIQLLAANNFLYFFGVDSVNVIADVNLNSAGTALLFSNTNISANSGTNLPQAIFPYYRAIWYMNQSGIYALYGVTPRKASDELDGIFPHIDFTRPVTSGTCVIYNILCALFAFTYNDPVQGPRKIMVVFFNKKWFVVSQGPFILISTVHGSSDRLMASLGDSIFKPFDNTTASIAQIMKTALWELADMVHEKQALKVGLEANITDPSVGSINPTVDTETTENMPTIPFSKSLQFLWQNSLGQAFMWVNSLNQTFTWLLSGYLFMYSDVEAQGHYLGVTLESDTPQIEYSGIQLQYRVLPGGWWA